MSERTLKRILTALALALLVYSVLGIVQRVRQGARSGNSGFARVLSSVDTATLETVRLTGPADTLVLERVNSTWTVNGYTTDPEAVARLLRAVTSSQVGDVVATNPANHERLGVAGPEIWMLRFENIDGHPMEFILGKTGVRFGTAFARLTGEDAVITLIGDLRPSVVRPLDQWRDKRVASADTAQIAFLDVETGTGDYRLSRSGDGWRIGSAVADSFTVATLLGELAQVTAMGFVEPGSELPTERRSLVATTAAGDTLLALEGWVDGSTFVVRRPHEPTLFEMSSWRAARMVPPPDSLRAR